MGSLEGKVAVITGASRGIGRVTARHLAAEGCAIYLAADGTAAELDGAAGEVHEGVPLLFYAGGYSCISPEGSQ